MNLEMTNMVQEMIDVMKKAKARQGVLAKELATCDKQVATYEHLIECGQFPANVRATIYKELDALLDKRRDVKLELAQMHSMFSALEHKKTPVMDNVSRAGTFKFTAEGLEKEFQKYMKYIKPEFKVVKNNGKEKETEE